MKKIISTIAAVIIVALMGIFFPEEAPEAPKVLTPISGNGLTIHFIDVGKADCALLECDGKYMIIDGGNVEDGQMVVSYLQQMGVETIDRVVCSHAHEDHVGGLPAVLSVFDAENVYAPVTDYDTKVFRNFLKKAEAAAGAITVPKPGDQFTLGSATCTVLGPVKEYADPNDTSIVLKVSYGDSDFLFTGDMEIVAENDMIDHWGEDFDWNVELLKVGHHGSSTSSGYRFIYETNPAYGVISVGQDNEYGHPHEEPMSRLKDAGLLILRTDELGHVIATTDGSEISFTWENQNAAPADAEPADPAMKILYGNKKSKTFHAYDCKSLPGESNRVELADYDTAIAQGYKPCSGCIG